MSKRIVFLDIDGTLLDENYKSNDPSLKNTILRLQEKNITFCLNSNRSLEDLLPVAKRFCIEGLLIGENGIFAFDTRSQQTQYFVNPSSLSRYVEQKQLHEKLVQEALAEQYKNNQVAWIDADTVSVLSGKSNLNDVKDDSIVALNNIYRNYTSSVHILRKTKDGLNPVKTNDLVSITKKVEAEASKINKMKVSYSINFSNILLTPIEATKRGAVKELLKITKYSKNYIYGIGDEAGDYKMVKDLGSFFSVANATEEAKKSSKLVSSNPYTKGVHELLLKL